METKRFTRSFLQIAITAFLVLLAGNAFAIDNKTRVVSPYWQVDSGTYTFIAVSHSSLSGMASQIGIKVNALDNSGAAYATAISFTISAGNTQRIFIVPTNDSTINSSAISSALFLAGTSNFKHGHIVVEPIATDVTNKEVAPFSSNIGKGFRDATMLTYWGSVIIKANTTGFAMEFIGDMNDSTQAPAVCDVNGEALCSFTAPGVNLQ